VKRKQFLSACLPLTLINPFSSLPSGVWETTAECKEPPCLKAGDLIGITCPGGNISTEELLPCINMLKSWGFEVKLGATPGKKDGVFGGTDAERLADLQQMLDDESIKAILCARGGYGTVRIIDRIDFSAFKRHPKWIIGFSDITVLHSHIFRHMAVATLHSKMCNSFPEKWEEAEESQRQSILAIRSTLESGSYSYEMAIDVNNRMGEARGILIGGNLKTIESLAGTPSDIHTHGCILFLEDTGEYLYSIDRMFWNLKRSGKLDSLTGLIIGGFRVKPDDPGEEFSRDLYAIVMEKVKEYRYPVCFNFPVGHQPHNLPLICGKVHDLQVGPEKVILRT
jgi:muramoyltetrapeptide carboxypeptidase